MYIYLSLYTYIHPGKEQCPPLHLGVVATEKGTFKSPLTKVTYIHIFICIGIYIYIFFFVWHSVESLKVYGQITYKRHYYLSTYQGLQFHSQRKDETNPTSIRPTKKTVAAIMILNGNTKVKVYSPDGDTEYFDIVAGVLQGDTLAPYLFIICLDYVLRTLMW